MLAPLVVLEVWLLMSATDQLIVAVAGTIIVLNGLLPSIFAALLHKKQGKKLDRIDRNTNGALAAVTLELAAVKAKLAELEAAAARQHPPGAF